MGAALTADQGDVTEPCCGSPCRPIFGVGDYRLRNAAIEHGLEGKLRNNLENLRE